MARISRLFGVTTATLALAVLLGACATPVEEPTVAPTVSMPTPTATTDAGQAAFEAAEATYRAYLDAYNAAVFSDPATFEAVYEYASGALQDVDRESLTEASAEGLVKGGETVLVWFVDARDNKANIEEIVADACVDVSSMTVVDEAGTSLVPETSSPRELYRLWFEASAESDTGYLLVSRKLTDRGESC